MNKYAYVEILEAEEADFEVIESHIKSEGYIPKTVEELDKFEIFLKLSPEMSLDEFERRMTKD